jgi:hypothetical protein
MLRTLVSCLCDPTFLLEMLTVLAGFVVGFVPQSHKWAIRLGMHPNIGTCPSSWTTRIKRIL